MPASSDDSKIKQTKRMSFVFPPEFYDMLGELKRRYGKDMTYIVMEAVNEWVMSREGIEMASQEMDSNSIFISQGQSMNRMVV